MMLKLLSSSQPPGQKARGALSAADAQALQDHQRLIEGFLQSHRIRNHQETTLAKNQRFLLGWFENHGPPGRPLYTWEAMAPVTGRKRIVDYGKALLETGISSPSIRDYLGTLSRYFSYVLEHPYLFSEGEHCRIQDRYGPIDQPVSEYDTPTHCRDSEHLGIPIEPERLYELYAVLRKHYLGDHPSAARARNYALAVLAGETGLRSDELLSLEVSDLFFESHRIQTRQGKATRGSGKRSRLTLFPPLARDTLRYYLHTHREKSPFRAQTSALFFSKTGNRLDYPTIQRALREMIQAASHAGFPVLPQMTWHSFRRVFATRFIERFPNQLPVLIQLLGHSNPNTVHAYIRHSEAWMNRQIQTVLEGARSWPSVGN